jgi:hypothetical protein
VNVAQTKKQLTDEAHKATKMLRGRVVRKVWRHRPSELGIEFDDGVRLFADVGFTGLQLSITGDSQRRVSNRQPNK